METPLVSVIVPVYKVEKYLDECVESIVNQTYRNLEIILIDDGSPDGSPQLCDNWAHKDPRVMVIHKPNGGLSDARNAGLEIAKGEYVMFVDSDDFIDKNTISDLLTNITDTDSDIACGGIYKYYDANSIHNIYNEHLQSDITVFDSLQSLKNLLNSMCDCSSVCKLYRSSVIRNSRFIKGRYNEDVIFLFYIYKKCNRIVYSRHRYYYYRATIGSVTSQLSEKTMDQLRNMIEMEDYIKSESLPLSNEIKNYKCRVCLELGYAIQRDNAALSFPEETQYVKNHIRSRLPYIFRSHYYNLRDIVHALIVLIRL